MTKDLTISCPHCRRQYPIKVDPERLQRLKTRATCGRCGNAFDVAARVAAAAAPPPSMPPGRGGGEEWSPSSGVATSSGASPSPGGSHGAGQHGSATHGSATHGSATHGSATHGSATHGSAVHGSAVHGSPPPGSSHASPQPLPGASVPLRLERIKPPAPPSGAGSMEPDDMAELAREFADAAARFTPVKPRPPLSAATTSDTMAHTMRVAPPPPPAHAVAPLPLVSTFSAPTFSPPSPTSPSLPPPPMSPSSLLMPGPGEPLRAAEPDLASTVAVAPVPHPPAAGSDEGDLSRLMLEDPGDNDFDAAENTMKRAKQTAVPPPTWLELADPGLDGLAAPVSKTAALLDGILSQPGSAPATSSLS